MSDNCHKGWEDAKDTMEKWLNFNFI
jgi:hypothetical protein